MEPLYYDMIFKRKSFHRFAGTNRLTEGELCEIQTQITALIPLVEHIRTAFRIVPREQTTCKRGEYCILIYSEPKEFALQNVGYLAEQLDLWLASKQIGTCWYGMGWPNETKYDGLDFVILIAIGKGEESEFRRDYTKAKRKMPEEFWDGTAFNAVSSVVRYAPSACNTQPWFVESEQKIQRVYRVLGKRGMMSKERVPFYNRIDMGIFLLFMELCFSHEQYFYIRQLYPDREDGQKKALNAVYEISK